jgi:hypothetical protein
MENRQPSVNVRPTDGTPDEDGGLGTRPIRLLTERLCNFPTLLFLSDKLDQLCHALRAVYRQRCSEFDVLGRVFTIEHTDDEFTLPVLSSLHSFVQRVFQAELHH